MKVAVGGIIHDRWTLEPYFRAMRKLRSPRNCEVLPIWVVDVQDDEQQVPEFRDGEVVIYVERLPGRRYNRQASRDREVYGRLACLRNILAEAALGTGCDALLSVDSDIIVPADLLQRLVATGKEWVAPLVRNDTDGGNPRGHWNVFKLTQIATQGGLTDHFRPMGPGFPTEDVLAWDPRDPKKERCLAAGAVCLYGRALLSKARWATDGRGQQEDIGFGVNAFAAGFRAWYIPLRCQHLTVNGLETG